MPVSSGPTSGNLETVRTPQNSGRQRASVKVPECRQEGLSRTRAKPHREEPESGMSQNKRHPNAPLGREIDGLRQQSVGQLRVKYREVFGPESRSNHKQFLVRRIAWRVQANAEGELSERAAVRREVRCRYCTSELFWDPRMGVRGLLARLGNTVQLF